MVNGYGLRFTGTWSAPAHVISEDSGSTSDLRFGSVLKLGLRAFVDFNRKEDLVAKMPFLKNVRLSFKVANLLDSRQKVTDENNETPIAYQKAYRDPEGRVLSVNLRKMF